MRVHAVYTAAGPQWWCATMGCRSSPGVARQHSKKSCAAQLQGDHGSRTCSLRILTPLRKPGTMPPYHPVVRGLCHDSTPFLLSARSVGTTLAMCDAACRLAQPKRRIPAEASRGGTHQAQAHTLPGAPTVCGPDTQAALCPVCARSRASPSVTSGATRADAPDPVRSKNWNAPIHRRLPTSRQGKWLPKNVHEVRCKLTISRLQVASVRPWLAQ